MNTNINAVRLNLPEINELNEMSLRARLTWCDVSFCFDLFRSVQHQLRCHISVKLQQSEKLHRTQNQIGITFWCKIEIDSIFTGISFINLNLSNLNIELYFNLLIL